MRVRTQHVYHGIDPAAFAEMYFSEAYNRAIAPLVSMAERSIESLETLEDGRVRRRILMKPRVQLPAMLQKLVQGAELAYYEISVFDPVSCIAHYHIETGAGDLLAIQGTIAFEPVDQGVCRTIDGQIDVSIFGVGKIVERFISQEVSSRYDRIHKYTQQYIDQHVALAGKTTKSAIDGGQGD